MNDKLATDKEIVIIKRKLDAAISSKTLIENDLKSQASIFIPFIAKLSQTCKGLDVTLDNRLGNLRSLLKKSAPLTEIETQINKISQLLQQYSSKNNTNIRLLHDKFHSAGQSLQKTNGLPAPLRRKLRVLIKESDEVKDALIQYIPSLSELLAFYDEAIKAKIDDSTNGLLSNQQQRIGDDDSPKSQPVDKQFIDKFSSILNDLVLSDIHTKHISSIKLKLSKEMTNDHLFNHFFEVFDVIVDDLKQERNTAKIFLSTLSEALSTVQSAVKTTLSTQNQSAAKHDKLNVLLQKQVSDMACGLNKATSLADIKVDINEKLQLIAGTLKKKSTLEYEQQLSLRLQMTDMAKKVDQLEKQSKTFEKRIQEQQAKSMQDALTKLSNRAAFDEYFTKKMVHYHHSNFELAIVVLDLDDFKRINDTYGHTAGDKTLQVIANTLQKHIGEDAFIARYGGEEFVLIFSNFNKEKTLKKLDTLRKQVARLPFKFKDNKVNITVSIGVSHVKEDDNIHIAFERADTALYQAKAQGKNQVVYI
ncbi:MAG: GGDEF domain-containing protein [Colwellia sp.]|nr:GGDEF domain-containing protein [Colwellia sp.]